MPNPQHAWAQDLSAKAELARAYGNIESARNLYLEAAEAEQLALREVPADKPRTRGILAVSLAALSFKAARYNRAEAAICSLMADETLASAFRGQLRELLPVTWEEQLLEKEQLSYSGEELLVALRGGKIGHGEAPANVAVNYLNSFNLLAYRIAELEAGLPLRRHGLPSPEIRAALPARATQPASGSYRFSIKFVEPRQQELFPQKLKSRSGGHISDLVVGILRAVSGSDRPSLERLVETEEYRVVLAQLARNLVPTGKSLAEVEVRTARTGPLEAITLVPGLRRNLNETIRDLTPPPQQSDLSEDVVVGTLRAVHLDRQWLRIVPDAGSPVEVKTQRDVLDDVVGPMVNRRVSARVARSANPKAQDRLLDIELQED